MRINRILFPLLAAASLLPFVPSWAALVCGMAAALILGNPYTDKVRKLTPRLLAFSVMGLGAAMDLEVVGRVGLHGILYTIIGIAATLAAGYVLGKWLGVERDTAMLVSAGTAICGGSAIAAVSAAIRAKPQAVSVSLATVFFLNATALILFPWLGHYFAMDEVRFGLWSALAIHDTSSVVGSAMQYGSHALEIATTVKLARALWIIPVTVAIVAIHPKDSAEPGTKPKRPWFIVGFLAAAALVTWVPQLRPAGALVAGAARRSLVLTLFFIGSTLTRDTVRTVGARPFIQGFVLWILMGGATLAAINKGWIGL